MLPVVVKSWVVGSYSSAVAVACSVGSYPPVISTFPFVSRVAVWYSRATFRLAVGTKPAVNVKLKNGAEVTPFKLAVMFVLPVVIPVANPCVPAVLLMVATAVFDEFHVALLVRF